MKVVIQRVSEASVSVNKECVGKIGAGYMILVGVGQNDTEDDVIALAKKTAYLRIFEDENGKMNRSLLDIGGEVLSISQFTLLADCRHGRRPSFIYACEPVRANELYEMYNSELLKLGVKKVEKGIFGADMKVALVNDGPVTILLDSGELKR